MEEVDRLVAALAKASYADRESIKAQLLELARGPSGAAVRDQLDSAKRGQLLEVQWEIEEVIDATAPKKAEPPKKVEPPPEPPPDPNRPLTAKDLVLVYDDPRGLLLHKSKVGDRWFATQADPRTGQPQTFELHPQEIAQLRTQLKDSPYWVLGAGTAAATPSVSPAATMPGARGPGRPGGR